MCQINVNSVSQMNALFMQREPALRGGEAIDLTDIINSYNKKHSTALAN